MAYENFYQGTPYALDPQSDEFYTGAKLSAGSIGGTTSVQSANQLREVSNLLNTGMIPAEISAINPEVFEMIPQQHLKELDRQAKLTGAEMTLHAPIIEPSGFTQQGWNEQNRELSERHLASVVLRAHEISPDKPMPVTIHSSAIPGTETMPIEMFKQSELTDEEKTLKEIPTQLIAVNQETGDLVPLRREIRHYPTSPEGKIFAPTEELEIANESYWDNKLSQLLFYKERGDEILTKNFPMVAAEYKELSQGNLPIENLGSQQKVALSNVANAQIYLKNTHQSLNSLFNEAYKVSNEKGKEALKKASIQFKDNLERGSLDPTKYSTALQGIIRAMQQITVEGHKAGIRTDIYKPIEEFATDKASETFSNVALKAYDKFGNKAPIISIENPPYGTAISTAETLRALIERSREKFVEKAVKKGMTEAEAKKAAESMIGATWDTSHISMIRKQGFKEQELIKQAEIIAPFVKHVHLNDNLGFTHTDLPPGMGTVPIKEILKKFGKEEYKGKHIFEGGAFVQHFKTIPHGLVLEATGSPIYSAIAQPTWTQIYGSMGGYASGYGNMLPEQNFSIYGGGFSGLPQELGGQIPGKQSRLSGTPMT